MINIRNFYIRRILRIWPLYFLCILIGFFLFPVFKSMLSMQPEENANILYYLFFISNFDMISSGHPDSSILAMLWSISIEEQFYLVWPVLVSLIPFSSLPVMMVLVTLVSIIFRCFYCDIDSYIVLELHSLSVMSDMAIGGLAAWLTIAKPAFVESIRNLSRRSIYLIYLSIILVFLFRKEVYEVIWLIPFERVIVALIIAMVILEQNYADKSFFKWSNFKTISKWGLIAYGLYCFHMMSILIIHYTLKLIGLKESLLTLGLIEFPSSLALTILIAKISYKYFESFFLGFKDRFSVVTRN